MSALKKVGVSIAAAAVLGVPHWASAGCFCGDHNGDGDVTVRDALIVLKLSVGELPSDFGEPVAEGVHLSGGTGEQMLETCADANAADDAGMVAWIDPETGEFLDEPPTNDTETLIGDVIEPVGCLRAPAADDAGFVAYIDPETGEFTDAPEGSGVGGDVVLPRLCVRVVSAL